MLVKTMHDASKLYLIQHLYIQNITNKQIIHVNLNTSLQIIASLHLQVEVANPLLLMLQYQPQPLTELMVAGYNSVVTTALKAKTMWNMGMVVIIIRLSQEASGIGRQGHHQTSHHSVLTQTLLHT